MEREREKDITFGESLQFVKGGYHKLQTKKLKRYKTPNCITVSEERNILSKATNRNKLAKQPKLVV